MAAGINSQGMRADGRRASETRTPLRRPKAKGEPFSRALWAIFDHPDYIALSKTSRAFLWDTARLYNGFNNGNISIAPGIMKKYGWDKKTILRCRDELIQMNWLAITRLPRAKRQPILYRLTWLEVDTWEGNPKLDADAFKQGRRSLKADKK
jgi:hypothetical protein